MTNEADICGSCLDSNDLSYVVFIRASGGRLTTLSSVCEWTFGKHVGQIQDTALHAKTLKVGIIANSTRPCYLMADVGGGKSGTGLLCRTNPIQNQRWADKDQHPPSLSQNLYHTMVPKDVSSLHCNHHCFHDWNGDVEHFPVHANRFGFRQDRERDMH